MKRINTQGLAAAVGISLCGGLLADAFPLTPVEATNPLVIDISAETTLADYLTSLGGGGISQYDALVKRGTGTLVISAAISDFTGTIVVEAGTLSARVTGALGTAAGATYVKDGAMLEIVDGDSGTPDLSSETFILAGTGIDGKGAVYRGSVADGSKSFGPISLAANATVASLASTKYLSTIALNGFDLTFAGPSVTTMNGDVTGPGRIIQSQGFLAFGKGKLASGDTAGSILIQKGAGWTTGTRWEYSSACEWPLVFADGAEIYHRDAQNETPRTEHYWNGSVTFEGSLNCWKIGDYQALYTFNGPVSGSGDFNIGAGFTLAFAATSGDATASITKTGDGDLVYGSLVGVTSLTVQKGSVTLNSVVTGRTGTPGITETYSEGVGNKINDLVNYPVGTVTNGVFSNARYASYGNSEFVNNMVGQKANTTWVYDGYLWVPDANNGEAVTWTWLAGVQAAMAVYVDGTRILDTASEAVYNAAINVNTVCKEVMKNVALAPGRHHLQVRCYSSNGWCGGYLWNDNAGLSLTSMGLMVATNNLMTTTQSDYMLLTDPGDGSLLTATTEKSVDVLSCAAFESVVCASGTTLAIGNEYTLKSLTGFPTVTGGDLMLTGTYCIDASAEPSKLTVEGTLTFGEGAEISVTDAAAFKKKRTAYGDNYVLIEAAKIEGEPKASAALNELGWKVMLNDAKTQLLLVRVGGFAIIIR